MKAVQVYDEIFNRVSKVILDCLVGVVYSNYLLTKEQPAFCHLADESGETLLCVILLAPLHPYTKACTLPDVFSPLCSNSVWFSFYSLTKWFL